MTGNRPVPNHSPQFARSRSASHLVSHRKAWGPFPHKTSQSFERGQTGTLKGERVLQGGERWSWAEVLSPGCPLDTPGELQQPPPPGPTPAFSKMPGRTLCLRGAFYSYLILMGM